MTKFSATADDAGRRLDVFLAGRLAITRSQVQKIIANDDVLVNDKIANAHYKVQEHDKIIIKTKKLGNKETSQKNKTLPKLDIIQETDDYIIINKPAGVIVHRGNGITQPTLADALEQYYPAVKKIGEDPHRPGIVHRLDKEASGLMVVAKTNAMFESLKEQFQTRAVHKKYFALVYGVPARDHDEISFAIARSANGYKMAAKPQNQDGRRAITEFRKARQFVNYTLLDITIKTGRTHQIRVHLSAYGHPLVGDMVYATQKTKLQNKKVLPDRIFLHAYELGFNDLQNSRQTFNIELPAKLKHVLQAIK